MAGKKPNPHIDCNVKSCAHHCGECDNCSLDGIKVCACADCDSGCAQGESLCGSYRAK